MTMTIEAVYDGKAFLPVVPLSIKPNTRVKISVLTAESEPVSFLDVARSLELDGPPDGSEKSDETTGKKSAKPIPISEFEGMRRPGGKLDFRKAAGLGRDVWIGINAAEYLETERESWD